ncbi:Peptidoglycan-N-acetylglucosamine deacetylase [Dyadobacter sp. CECT 9275]|uniref:Peptidoglycan-N-acetylglucosamine deacetylase n=1 Tax=Dyadobacter helix TaxID=2822344 RepID=A0A916JAF1_9BACT|nr:polysaccharide deacetylase family protein [Dyadobacter sp. CECT 9275]CAG4995051.1 Peptidoglycan-N-acetylglucosamine deacetylase [Dyadobacter sp. CECT 9275]
MKHNIVTYAAATAIVVLGFIFWETGFAYFVIGGIALLYLSITAYGSAQIGANYFLRSINRGTKKSIALTFDDGPDPDNTPRILAILREKQVSATFFVIGKKAEKEPALLRQILAEGHTVANHSYSHNVFIGFFSTARLVRDFEKCNQVIQDITGKRPAYLRPPFGVTNPRYAAVLQQLHMHSIGWSLRSLDTRAKNKYQLIDRILTRLKKRDIVLLHDHLSVTADALEDVIEHCRQKRVVIEPLHTIIQKEPYA